MRKAFLVVGFLVMAGAFVVALLLVARAHRQAAPVQDGRESPQAVFSLRPKGGETPPAAYSSSVFLGRSVEDSRRALQEAMKRAQEEDPAAEQRKREEILHPIRTGEERLRRARTPASSSPR